MLNEIFRAVHSLSHEQVSPVLLQKVLLSLLKGTGEILFL